MTSEHTAVITNAPDRIFLNMGFDEAEGDVDFKACEEVTWCVDRQSPRDIEYVRVATLNSEAHERAWACYNALANVADPAGAMAKVREALQAFGDAVQASPLESSLYWTEPNNGTWNLDHHAEITMTVGDIFKIREALAAIGGGK